MSVRPAICDLVSATKKLLLDFHKIRHNSSFKLVYQVKIPFTNKYTSFFLIKRTVKISLCLLLHVSVQLDHPQGAYAELC